MLEELLRAAPPPPDDLEAAFVAGIGYYLGLGLKQAQAFADGNREDEKNFLPKSVPGGTTRSHSSQTAVKTRRLRYGKLGTTETGRANISEAQKRSHAEDPTRSKYKRKKPEPQK